MIHRFCISHTKPLLPEGWYDECISLGDYEVDSPLHVGQLDQFWHDARPVAYGAAGVSVLPIAIEKFSDGAGLIEVSTYRKRTLPLRVGRESRVYPTMRELDLGQFCEVAEISAFSPANGCEFLVPQPLHLKNSIVGNYAAVHHRSDILNYASLAVEAGVVETASEFLDEKYFIPAGAELGIYPKDWLTEAQSKIERVSRQFLERYAEQVKEYNNFQVRAVGFLGERLGSFLLIRHLLDTYSNDIPAEIFGYMTTIVGDDAKYTAGLADRPKKWSIRNRRKHSGV